MSGNQVVSLSATERPHGPPVNGWSLPTEKDRESEGVSGLQAFRQFTTEVSVAGLKYVTNQDALTPRRLIWLALVLFGFSFAAYQIILQTRYYLTYPTNINIRIATERSVSFPTVTLCNENVYNRSAVERFDPKVAEAFRIIFPPLRNTDMPYNFAAGMDLLQNHLDKDWTPIWPTFYSDALALMPGCVFNSKPCTPDMYQTIDSEAGRCLRFNPEGTLTTEQSGSYSGLQLRLLVDQDNYLTPLSPAVGYRVAIHGMNEPAYVVAGGFYANVNQQTRVQITKQNIFQKPSPYGRCSDEAGYVRGACVYECTINYILETCGCLDFSSEIERRGTNISACNPVELFTCFIPKWSEFLANDLLNTLCDCPQQCTMTLYPSTVSANDLSEFFTDWFTTNSPTSNMTPDFVRKNMVFLDIFYSQLDYEELKVQPAYPLMSLLCDIGGALGLVLGSTVLTIFEVGDFVFVLLWQGCGKTKTNSRRTP